MQFFKAKGIITDEDWSERYNNRHIMRENVRRIAMKGNAFNQKQKKRNYVNISSNCLNQV